MLNRQGVGEIGAEHGPIRFCYSTDVPPQKAAGACDPDSPSKKVKNLVVLEESSR